ncbi:MAG: NAD/FAD-utilizing enzyme [Cellvibrionales bacterium]|nr:NAD/FAD-utilizing enzyme [Cellvibrionales bacterium]
MKRHFYLSADLNDLELIEEQLEAEGLSTPQIHVISRDEAGLDHHQKLNQVHQWFQTDVVHSTLKGALIGMLAATVLIIVAIWAGLTTVIGWPPFVFLSIILLGFCTWEAGFIGTQLPNRHFKRFQKALESGKHLLMVDVNKGEEAILRRVAAAHPKLHHAGEGGGAPRWTIFGQKKAREFVEWAP